jgi:hypothetical protein
LRRFLGSLPCGASLPWRPSFPKWKADVDKAFHPLCHPSMSSDHAYGVPGFGKVPPSLAPKLFLGEVTALRGLHAMTVRLGPRALGPTLPGLVTLCGVVPSLVHPYPGVCKLLRRLAFPRWRRFESSWMAYHLCV